MTQIIFADVLQSVEHFMFMFCPPLPLTDLTLLPLKWGPFWNAMKITLYSDNKTSTFAPMQNTISENIHIMWQIYTYNVLAD